MSPLRLVGALAIVAALALLNGCGGGRAASAAPVSTDHVDLPKSYRFEPAVIEVPAGTTVTWTNDDNFTHSIQVEGQTEVYSLKPGERVAISFDRPGEYSYLCTYHPQNMKGKVIVTGSR
jgi:plastocyanin